MAKFWVGVTDNDWFENLAQIQPDEVNFWQPHAYTFSAIPYYSLFLLKLPRPYNHIAGGGFFIRQTVLPLSLAWGAFEEKNGAQDYETLRLMIQRKRREIIGVKTDPEIGCIILATPFFFGRDQWIPVPEDWSPNIERGKLYDTDDEIGLRLWSEVLVRLPKVNGFRPIQEEGVEYIERVVHQRLGQGAFRVLVTDAYERQCAITEERTLPVLQAAHIKPVKKGGPHRVSNGLLLRADLHILFERGYLTINKDFQAEVSRNIKEKFHNGEQYLKFRGRKLFVPRDEIDKPSLEFIEWHNNNSFVG